MKVSADIANSINPDSYKKNKLFRKYSFLPVLNMDGTKNFKSDFCDKIIEKLSLRNISMAIQEQRTKDRKFSNIIELISKHYYESFNIYIIISPFSKDFLVEKLTSSTKDI